MAARSGGDSGPGFTEPGELATEHFWKPNATMSMRRDLPVESACSVEDMGALPADSGKDEGEKSRPVLSPLIKGIGVGGSSQATICTCNDKEQGVRSVQKAKEPPKAESAANNDVNIRLLGRQAPWIKVAHTTFGPKGTNKNHRTPRQSDPAQAEKQKATRMML